MLTRNLLQYRVRNKKVMPVFINDADPELLNFSAALLHMVETHVGSSRSQIQTLMAHAIMDMRQPLVGRGLAKLVCDGLEFADPDPHAVARRQQLFHQSAAVLAHLPAGASRQLYQDQLQQHISPELRKSVYDDLPDRRPLVRAKSWHVPELLARYNLAQVQGLLLYSRQLRIGFQTRDRLRLRRVLRWLKFCRLVVDIRRQHEAWTLQMSGPAALFSLQKKYGLQLAMFISVVPVLEHYSLDADIEMRRSVIWQLHVGSDAPLKSPHARSLGYIPQEIRQVAQSFQDKTWRLDLEPPPRHVGATGLCVPDVAFYNESGQSLSIELFHRWHQGPLTRRLQELKVRPDPHLWLGIDRALLGSQPSQQAIANHPQVFLFSGFPTQKRFKEVLQKAFGPPH